MEPEFSERQFEFINKHRLARMPYIPSQNEEANVGYDVKYNLAKGKSAISLMLQFKTSHFVRQCSRTNSHIYNCYNGSYFKFPIMKKRISDQHDIMVRLASIGEHIYYCAPKFYTRAELESFYSAKSIMQNSRLFDPADMGFLPDNNQHHVSYDILGYQGYFHSKNKKEIRILKWDTAIPFLKHIVINETYLFNLKKNVIKAIKGEHNDFLNFSEKFYKMSTFYQINYMLSIYLDVAWILIPESRK